MNEDKYLLLVDDNRNDQELTLRALEGQKFQFRVCVANDGVEAMEFLLRQGDFRTRSQGNPTTVLLDLKMPRLDGFEVLQSIKNDPVLRTIPVVVFTSSNQQADVRRCYELGANAYVVKPVDYQQFVACVQNIGMFWSALNEAPPSSFGGDDIAPPRVAD